MYLIQTWLLNHINQLHWFKMVILTCHYYDKYLNCCDIVWRPNRVPLFTFISIYRYVNLPNWWQLEFLRMCCCYWYPSFKFNLFYIISSGTRFYVLILDKCCSQGLTRNFHKRNISYSNILLLDTHLGSLFWQNRCVGFVLLLFIQELSIK